MEVYRYIDISIYPWRCSMVFLSRQVFLCNPRLLPKCQITKRRTAVTDMRISGLPKPTPLMASPWCHESTNFRRKNGRLGIQTVETRASIYRRSGVLHLDPKCGFLVSFHEFFKLQIGKTMAAGHGFASCHTHMPLVCTGRGPGRCIGRISDLQMSV